MCRWKWLQLRPSRMLLHIFLSIEMLQTHNFLFLFHLPLHKFLRWNNYFYFLFHSIANYYKLPFGAVRWDQNDFYEFSRKILKMLSIVYASASLLISMECSFHIFVSLHDDDVELLLQQCFVVKWRVLKWMGE